MSEAYHFTDRLIEAAQAKGSSVVVGLDTDPRRLPQFLMHQCGDSDGTEATAKSNAQLAFNEAIVDAVHSIVPAVKVQIAYYEMLGPAGLLAYQSTIRYAHEKGLLVIGDIKRGDIGSTADAYAEAHLGNDDSADAVTVNPYMGSDGILPFVEVAKRLGKGVFVLVKTSNPSSSELQDLQISDSGERVYESLARKVQELGADCIGRHGYSLVGAVVGATYPAEGENLRRSLPHTFFLVPGYGAQGAGAGDVAGCFDATGMGAIVNASRSIIFAYEKRHTDVNTLEGIGSAAREAAEEMRVEINKALKDRRG